MPYLKKAIEAGNLAAMFEMVGLMHEGLAVHAPEKAWCYMKMRHVQAIWKLSSYCGQFVATPMVIYDPQRAFGFYSAAAKQNHPEGLFQRADMLLRGRGKNFLAAAQELMRAAEQGTSDCPVYTGRII